MVVVAAPVALEMDFFGIDIMVWLHLCFKELELAKLYMNEV